MDDRIIFQSVERTEAKCHHPIDMESEDDQQELQAEWFDPYVFYKHRKKLKLS